MSDAPKISPEQDPEKQNERPNLLDVNHPMLKPLWVRVCLTALCLGWSLFEMNAGSAMWGVLFGGMGLYLIWAFFLSPRKK